MNTIAHLPLQPSAHLLVEINEGVAWVWLNRPEVRNAFNEALIAELTQVFTQLAQDDSVRTVVLAGKGKTFCAGADLNWMQAMVQYTEAENEADAMRLATMLHAIYSCPKPVVARIHGACFAGGVGLAAVCDVVLALDAAHFCLSEVRLGLIPATISPYVIAAMGQAAAKRYFISAEIFSAAQAQQFGLVHDTFADEAALDAALQTLLAQLCSNAPQAMAAAKKLVQDYAHAPIDQALRLVSARRIAKTRMGAEAQSRIAAFLQKS